jgi:release factor glutamine methyltransferase
LEIAVNRHVLVPRQETELLAEAGWQFLSALNPQPSTALDFGTGSGCIAIALAAKCSSVLMTALDVSAEALSVARENARRNGVTERIEFIQGDGFKALSADGRFDLVISNPPYIPTTEIASLEPEVRDFDPCSALDGGPDGLEFYRRIAAEAVAFLKPGGKIMLEMGDGQAAAITEIFEAQKWIVEAVREDYTRRQRIFIARR